MLFRPKKKMRYIAGLDIGSSAVRLAVGHRVPGSDGHAHVQIIGVAGTPSEGVHRGVVTSIEELVSSLASALEQAERTAGVPIEAAWVGMNGPHLLTQESRGVIAVAKTNGEVTEDDAERAITAARTVAIPLNYDILHVLPRSFSVDGQTGIRDPVGMTAMRLEVDTKIIYGVSTHVKNLTKAVYRTGIDIDDVVLSILADGEAVVTARQKELGIAVVNIGAATTSIVVYEEGDTIHVSVIPIGADHVTNDIAIGLKTSIDIAERVKIECGHCVPKAISKKDIIDLEFFSVQPAAGGSGRSGSYDTASRQYVAEIIGARMSEIFEKVNHELMTIGKRGLLPAGVFLTGGGSKIGGAVELGREELQLPVALGYPIDVTSATSAAADMGYTTAIGLVKWGARMGDASGYKRNPLREVGIFFQKFRGVKDWLMP